jgi:hypothetical protein
MRRWLTVNKRTLAFLSIMLIIIIVSSAVSVDFSTYKPSNHPFYMGVELAYGDFNSLKAMVDQVKDYTNVFVLGLPQFSINRTLLDQSCDYINSSGLNFIVLFTNVTMYSNWGNYTPAQWVNDAMQRYGCKFLAVYRWDEPGGDQIDHSRYQLVYNASSLTEAATNYTNTLGGYLKYFTDTKQTVLTADYLLYWFDYRSGYDTVLSEFGWNNSRQLQIALCRGAARANDKDWGAMITWTYSNWPYIESDTQLYDDLVLAYNNGAKYAIIFNYPENNVTQYGILDQKHLDAIKSFWNYQANNPPTDSNYNQVQRAYVMPADYGFGFRSASDNIWGLWSADVQTQKMWADTNNLTQLYGANFDIVFNEAKYQQGFESRYNTLIYWNQTQ